MTIGILVRTLMSRLLLLLIMIVYLIPTLIFLLLPKRWQIESKLFYWMEYIFCWLVLKLSFIPYTVVGAENVPHYPAIIVANHQSSFDIPVLVYVLKRYPHIWLAIKTLLDSPILRFIVPRLAVLVDMSTPIAGMRSLIEAIKIANGHQCHIIIFPEGGRYTDGTIHDFFAGYVILAKKTGRPIVPIYMNNLNKVYPPDSFWIHYYPVTVTVGKPMMIEEGESEEIFNQRVHRWFVDQAQG